MRYLLDTNVLSDFLKGQDAGLRERMTQAQHEQNACISVITRAELRYGQNLLTTQDKRRHQIDLLLAQFNDLPWTATAADCYGAIRAQLHRAGKPIGDLDTQIAAHALAEGLTLVTHNTRHFKQVEGLKLEDWRA
ncbi:type II toxin-antitoxin system VapC family toxin [Hylemonella sp. W303a]|uniref:type II toxin-antitoxin system VapC family toxin n=1 Tax=Hylemonella sp. W303a TaxID=3389873 RepID=UPI00396B34D3